MIADKKIAIVCNALAGAGHATAYADKIKKSLQEKNIQHTLFLEKWPPHLNDFTDVFIVGGDGTLNYFINHYPGIKIPLVIFKAGTGNDFNWLLSSDKTFEEQMNSALNADPKPIDIGRCNDRYFINGVGIGFEGEVAGALTGKKKRPGKSSFMICILKKIFSYRSINYIIESEGNHYNGKRLLIDISNGRRAGGGFHIAPGAKADDGLFDVIIADALTPIQRLKYLPIIEKGKHLKLSFIHHFHSKKISVETDGLLQYHLDGEYFEAQKLDIEILTAALLFRY